jgi:dienelactone hydrolase
LVSALCQEFDVFQYFPEKYSWSLAVAASIAMGAEISELDEALAPLVPLAGAGHAKVADETWYQNWLKLGERLASLAAADLERANGFSASSKYLRAANYYLMAERIASWSDPRRMLAYGKGLAAFREGLRLSGAPVERVEVDYEGAQLTGWLRYANTRGRQPAVLFYNGFDSIKEMHYLMFADIAARRGIATLFVDQEGTGEAIRYHNLPKRHDTEVSAGLFFDALAGKASIDPERIGIVGLSMGGYCAPRAAAFDQRFKCSGSFGGFYDLDQSWQRILGGDTATGVADGLPESGIHAMRVTGASSIEDAIRILKKRTLEGVLHRIKCPLLVVHGENDRQVALSHAERIVAGATNSSAAELRVFSLLEGAAEHCGIDVMSMQAEYVFDWAARVLGGVRG